MNHSEIPDAMLLRISIAARRLIIAHRLMDRFIDRNPGIAQLDPKPAALAEMEALLDKAQCEMLDAAAPLNRGLWRPIRDVARPGMGSFTVSKARMYGR